jgi:hypothetical protein
VDLFEPGSGSRIHDFTGGITRAGLVWTVRLPDTAVSLTPAGDVLTVDARDVAVVDDRGNPVGEVPALVTLQLTWTGRGRVRDRHGDVPAFSGRFFRRARARGVFAASAADFAFTTNPEKPVRSVFAELGTEQNGVFLAAATECPRCGP